MPYLVDIHAKLFKQKQNPDSSVQHVTAHSMHNLLGLGTRTGLPDNKREVINQTTINNLTNCSLNYPHPDP